MGLLRHLLLWPVTAPTSLARFSLDQVRQAAQRELTDEGRVQEELMEAQLLLELGEIDEAEYLRRESDVMARLREVRRWKEALGLQEPWKPLSMEKGDTPEGDDDTPQGASGPPQARPEEEERDLDGG